MRAMRSALSLALQPVRRHGRRVAWTPEFMGLGNLFQLAMWAHDGKSVGEARFIRSTPNLDPWLRVFPGLKQVVVRPEEVRFTDRRVAPWSETARRAGADGAVPLHEPVDITAVGDFLRTMVLPGAALDLDTSGGADTSLVVNVRRGDYYSDPATREQYGFNVEAYLRVAVEASISQSGTPSKIVLVSDDLGWCRRKLAWLSGIAPIADVAGGGAVSDFETVARARRMVITNSTFSYWAAHVSNVVHQDNHSQVWAPRFFDRSQNGGRSWLLDERWSVLETIPQGWDLLSEKDGVCT